MDLAVPTPSWMTLSYIVLLETQGCAVCLPKGLTVSSHAKEGGPGHHKTSRQGLQWMAKASGNGASPKVRL